MTVTGLVRFKLVSDVDRFRALCRRRASGFPSFVRVVAITIIVRMYHFCSRIETSAKKIQFRQLRNPECESQVLLSYAFGLYRKMQDIIKLTTQIRRHRMPLE